jgi:O-antigen/teichoic acid export membrane protein
VVLADVGFVIASMATALADVLQGFQCFESYASTSLISGLLLTAASVVAVAFWPGPVGMSFAYLVGPVVNLSLLLRHVKRWLFPVRMRWNLLRYRQLLSEVRTLGLQQFLSALQDRIEQLLVPKFAGVTAFGYYSAGSLPATRLAIFPDGLATAFYPAIARSAQEEKLSGTHNTSRQVTQFFAVSLVVCIPLALMMMFLAYPFSLILERHNAALCNDIIRITIWSVPLMAISLPMSWSLQAIGEQDRAARASMASTVFGLALSYILVSRFGVIGACWSGLGRSLLAVLFLLPTFIRFFPTVLPRVPFGRVLLCALAMALPLWSSTLGRNPGMVRFAAGCVAAVSFYLVALVLFRIITTSDLRAMMRSRRAVSVD